MSVVIRILVYAAALWVAVVLLRGLEFDGPPLALLAIALILGVANVIVKPILAVLSLPLVILTLGLFYLAINGAMFALAAWLLGGLTVDGCLPAILGGLVLAVFNWLVRVLFGGEKD